MTLPSASFLLNTCWFPLLTMREASIASWSTASTRAFFR
jgi:hypothetical protein